MADKKVKYVGPGGAERFVREDDPQAVTAARFDGFQPAAEAAKAEKAAAAPAAKKES